MEAAYCKSCTFVLRKLDSCPNTSSFEHGNFFDVLIQLIWVFCSVFPFILIIFLGVGLLKGRTPRLMLITCCLIVQVAVNELILKKIFAELRPNGACSDTYGLPSGHSSFASFFMTWLILEAIYLSKHASFKKEKHYIHFRNAGVLLSPFVPLSRFFLNYHTVKQICIGVAIGFLVAVTCFSYLTAKGYQAWYEGEVLLIKGRLDEPLNKTDLESDGSFGPKDKTPKSRNLTSLQPMQAVPEGDYSL